MPHPYIVAVVAIALAGWLAWRARGLHRKLNDMTAAQGEDADHLAHAESIRIAAETLRAEAEVFSAELQARRDEVEARFVALAALEQSMAQAEAARRGTELEQAAPQSVSVDVTPIFEQLLGEMKKEYERRLRESESQLSEEKARTADAIKQLNSERLTAKRRILEAHNRSLASAFPEKGRKASRTNAVPFGTCEEAQLFAALNEIDALKHELSELRQAAIRHERLES
jgi:hypothetical protein